MFYFNNDYSEGCHPKVLEALIRTNMEQTAGYGEDHYCRSAADKIRKLCGREDLSVHFLVGGTQTNMTVIAAALRPHQGALCACSGCYALLTYYRQPLRSQRPQRWGRCYSCRSRRRSWHRRS